MKNKILTLPDGREFNIDDINTVSCWDKERGWNNQPMPDNVKTPNIDDDYGICIFMKDGTYTYIKGYNNEEGNIKTRNKDHFDLYMNLIIQIGGAA